MTHDADARSAPRWPAATAGRIDGVRAVNAARTLVTGGRGKTGREVVQLLTEAGAPVNAGTRRPGTPHDLTTPVRFDWQDRRTWAEAVADVESIFLMRPDLENAPELVGEFVAQAPGAHVVLLSEQGAGTLADSSWERQVEIAVTDAAASWTLVRPSWFHQVMDDPRFYLTAIRDHGVLPISSAGATIAFVDARDIAAITVASLSDRALAGEAITVTGPDALSIAEAAAIVSDVSEREVRPTDPSRDEATAALEPWLAGIVGNMIERVHEGVFSEVTDDVLRLTRFEPRSLATFASERADVWRPVRG
ncbi:NAD(P)H-binding protein [Agromyces laixinhei]|uniref:NAD(P)H-binding protein n=1 Tax=Agromyces laixinhei TaxID=2585717 RepID=UPI001115BFB4|nr:NAD(P)H-binding protein [Agromyces laixinhei]